MDTIEAENDISYHGRSRGGHGQYIQAKFLHKGLFWSLVMLLSVVLEKCSE